MPFGIPGLRSLAQASPSSKYCLLELNLRADLFQLALILAASSLLTPSLTALGAASTRSLASLRPRPVIARTSLMTSIFLSPIAAA